jgi:hypothetical protein
MQVSGGFLAASIHAPMLPARPPAVNQVRARQSIVVTSPAVSRIG